MRNLRRARPIGKVIEISKMPEDYQQLLTDLDSFNELKDCRYIRIYKVKVQPLAKEVSDHWEVARIRDWEIILEFIQKVNSGDIDSLPPIMIEKGRLSDGFHRVSAFLMCGVVECRAIQLDKIFNQPESNLAVRG